MSWLLENWFGSKDSLEQVREEIQDHLHKEVYLGVSGIEHPEQSSTRLPAKEMFLTLYGPWDSNLNEAEVELMQYIHDELPPIVRDEVGVIPFFTLATPDGYLVLTYIRNATSRDIVINRMPLSLVTAEGEVVARKTFDMMTFGAIGDKSSRPSEFLFRWNEFIKIPEQEVPLTLRYQKPSSKKGSVNQETENGLSPEELSKYEEMVGQNTPVVRGQVELQVLDVISSDEGGLKVVALFSNGLEKRLEFTEVPIIIRDKSGEEVARVQFGMKNLKIEPKSTRLWAFEVPVSSLNKPNVDPADCTAFIPKARKEKQEQQSKQVSMEKNGPKGLVQ